MITAIMILHNYNVNDDDELIKIDRYDELIKIDRYDELINIDILIILCL
jgi:hypothetical protein